MRRHLLILLVSLPAAVLPSLALIGERPSSAADKPAGIDKRIPWISSRVVGSPEPPHPYKTERLFPNLRLEHPVDMAAYPLGKRWFVCDQHGAIYTFADDPAVAKAEVFLDLRQKGNGRNLWSMTFHPRFQTNGQMFVCYMDGLPHPTRCRISRFQVDMKKEPPVCNPASEFIVCEWLASEDHWGGCLKFGADGFLYFSVGDGSFYADGNESGQDLSDFHASILRIDVDRTDKGKAYAVPRDNPFINTPNARPEIWAYGMRNIWKMSFDRQSGDLWAGDVGQDLWEMIYRVDKAGNYGWSVTEGTHPFRPERKVGPTPILKPVVEHEHSEARSLTGGFVYRGQRLKDLIGAYVYGDFETGIVWALRYDGKKVTEHRELVDTPYKIVGFAEDNAGELFILDYTGTIHRLVPAPPSDPNAPAFPRLLSQTGLFRSTKNLTPEPGLIPYSVNSPLWSDHAHKERFMAIPGEAKVEYSPNDSWKFPEGTVLVKTFAMDMEHGKPASRKRLETRLLHLEQDHWRGYTYIWNDAQTDAALAPKSGADRKLVIRDPQAPTGQRAQTWRFPSRAECTLCHTLPVRFVLGLSTPQLNRDHDYGGVIDNQIRTLDRLGLFTTSIAAQHKDAVKEGQLRYDLLPRLPDPRDAASPLERRARSYLHANCAHCHVKWGGGNALFQLLYSLPLEATLTVNTPPNHGDLQVPDARVLVPGTPERSLMWLRMNRLGHGRMPHVASSVIDDEGVRLVRDWIKQLPPTVPNAK